VVTSLLHDTVEGQVVGQDIRPSCILLLSAGELVVGGCGCGAGGGGGGSRALSADGRVAHHCGPALVWTPSPCRGAAHCSRFYRWPTTGGPHAWLSACVARGTPTHCGGVSWVSSGRCPSPAVCGFPVVWVVCEDVRCGVRRVAGGCLSLVRGGGVFHVVGGGLHLGVALVDVRLDVVPLPPRSSSATVRVVGWVGFLLDMIGGVESALWEGYYPASALAMGSV